MDSGSKKYGRSLLDISFLVQLVDNANGSIGAAYLMNRKCG